MSFINLANAPNATRPNQVASKIFFMGIALYRRNPYFNVVQWCITSFSFFTLKNRHFSHHAVVKWRAANKGGKRVPFTHYTIQLKSCASTRTCSISLISVSNETSLVTRGKIQNPHNKSFIKYMAKAHYEMTTWSFFFFFLDQWKLKLKSVSFYNKTAMKALCHRWSADKIQV